MCTYNSPDAVTSEPSMPHVYPNVLAVQSPDYASLLTLSDQWFGPPT